MSADPFARPVELRLRCHEAARQWKDARVPWASPGPDKLGQKGASWYCSRGTLVLIYLRERPEYNGLGIVSGMLGGLGLGSGEVLMPKVCELPKNIGSTNDSSAWFRMSWTPSFEDNTCKIAIRRHDDTVVTLLGNSTWLLRLQNMVIPLSCREIRHDGCSTPAASRQGPQ